MKRFPYLPQKLFVLLIGVAVTEFGSQLFVALDVGADPFMILVQGISRQAGLSYGQSSTIIMLICLLAIFLFDRRYIHPGTLFCIFCLGPLVDFYAFLFDQVLPQNRPIPPHHPADCTWLYHRLHRRRHFCPFRGRRLFQRSDTRDCA